MDLALFQMDGILFLLRWLHFFFGIIWIGLLYYFNFVQGSFFAETDAATKSGAIQKLVPRALWWFRWAALFTVITGLLYLGAKGHRDGHEIFLTSWGISILTGTVMGIIMASNVWFVIWPNQKVVIASAIQVAGGGKAIPEAAACGAKAGLASRTNVFLSISLLFFMGAASHLPMLINPSANIGLLGGIIAVVLTAIEINALKGKMGPLTTVKGVITSGFVLAFALYLLIEALTK